MTPDNDLLPVRTGVNRRWDSWRRFLATAPRANGGEPLALKRRLLARTCSPCERG